MFPWGSDGSWWESFSSDEVDTLFSSQDGLAVDGQGGKQVEILRSGRIEGTLIGLAHRNKGE